MVKLYLKKLLTVFLYGVGIVGIYYVGYGILATFSNFFVDYPIVRYAILFGIPVAIVLRIVWTYRTENTALRREFLSSRNEQALSFKEKCQLIIVFPHFQSEMLAFGTYAFVFVLLFGIANAASAAWYASLLAGIVFFVLIAALCFAIDLFVWLLVCRKWLRDT